MDKGKDKGGLIREIEMLPQRDNEQAAEDGGWGGVTVRVLMEEK